MSYLSSIARFVLIKRLIFISVMLLVPMIARALPPGIGVNTDGSLYIANVSQFLESCPQSDPAITQIRADFTLFRNNDLVGDNIPCTSPVSSMPVSTYSDELIALQTLRVAYYMDMGRTNYLPWTNLRLYDWLVTQVDGIRIRDNSGAMCCDIINNKTYFIVGTLDDVSREMDKSWEGISATLALYAHEVRHTQGYFHTSCCGITGGCDQTYSEGNLSPYAIQWWLNNSWLNGNINVGLSCLNNQQQQSISNWMLGSNNSGFIARFCDDSPPFLQAPAVLGGLCRQNNSGWQANVYYGLHQQIVYDNRIYEARIAHTSQASWPPSATPTLWQQPTPPDYNDWSVQTHYTVGSKVRFNQHVFKAIQEHVSETQWQPTQVPALWGLVN